MRLSRRQVLNAIQLVAEQGCKWRVLPTCFGNWHTIYTRTNRWSRDEVLDRKRHFEHVFARAFSSDQAKDVRALCYDTYAAAFRAGIGGDALRIWQHPGSVALWRMESAGKYLGKVVKAPPAMKLKPKRVRYRVRLPPSSAARSAHPL